MSQVKVCSVAGSIKKALETLTQISSVRIPLAPLARGAYHYGTAYRVNCGFCLYRNLQWGGKRETSETTTTTREILSPRRAKEKRRREEREER